MKALCCALFVISAAMLAGGCGGDDNKSSSGGSCHDGCLATMAAACSDGPATQAQCESDCEMLRSGSCASEFDTLQTCGAGKTVTCSSGFPIVAACSQEQTDFVNCVSQP